MSESKDTSDLRPAHRHAPGAAVAWQWQKKPREAARAAAVSLRKQGLIQGIVGAIAGCLIFFFWHRNLAFVVWSLAALTLLAATLSPTGLYRRLSAAIEVLGKLIGRVLTILLLVPVFYTFFLFFGLFLRRGKNDRMQRAWLPEAPSYWRAREASEAGLERYERQF